MRFEIRHETTYRYSTPVDYSIQQLRLTPRAEPQQRALAWHIRAPGRLLRFSDTFGNLAHTLVLARPHDAVRVVVEGVLETEAVIDGRVRGLPTRGGAELSPLVYTVATPLTQADAAIRDLAGRHLHGQADTQCLLDLAASICEAVKYEGGHTEATSPAGTALAIGRGVCQDHAHLFLACCRAHGIPARYVSGYVWPGDAPHAASHAWVDAWLPDSGWISIDVTHRGFAGEQHCRLAIGRDYLSAAPVRGVRSGGGAERLEVAVSVQAEQ